MLYIQLYKTDQYTVEPGLKDRPLLAIQMWSLKAGQVIIGLMALKCGVGCTVRNIWLFKTGGPMAGVSQDGFHCTCIL